MQKAKLIKRQDVHDLRVSVENNVAFYQDGGFEKKIPFDQTIEDPSVEVDYDALSRLNPENTRQADIENALLVWNSLRGMYPYLARDERFWIYLTHFHCRDYIWKRWFPLGTKELGEDASEEEKEAFVRRIRVRFFVRSNRGFVMSNAVSRLWWWAYIASRYEGKDSDDKAVQLEKTLEVLLIHTGVRDAIINRPSIARGVNGFSAMMHVLIKRYDSNPNHTFFKFSSHTPYRVWLQEIERYDGDHRLLEALSPEKLKDIFEELAVEAEHGKAAPGYLS